MEFLLVGGEAKHIAIATHTVGANSRHLYSSTSHLGFEFKVPSYI